MRHLPVRFHGLVAALQTHKASSHIKVSLVRGTQTSTAPRCFCLHWHIASNPHGKVNHRPPVLTLSHNYAGHLVRTHAHFATQPSLLKSMNTTAINLEHLRNAIDTRRLVRGTWGFDNDPKAFVCALSAVVPGCRATQDACPVLGVPNGVLELFLYFYDNSNQYAEFALAFFKHDLPSKDWSRILDRFTLALFARMPKNISRSVHACEFLDQVAALVAERAAAPPHRRTMLTRQLRALADGYEHPATLSVGCALDIAAGDYVELAAQSALDAGVNFEQMKQDFLNTLST